MLVKVLCGRESFKVVGAPPLFVPTLAVKAAPTELEDSKASGSNGIGGPVVFKIPVKVSDERVFLRASVTTAGTVADRAVTSIDRGA